MNYAPYLRQPASVSRVMGTVLLALLPGVAAYTWLFGAAVLINLALASVAAVLAEALVLKLRGRPVRLAVGDLSAVVTAWLIVLTFPPLVPWWLTVLAAVLAIVVAKHLYGGLGQNPFNPAMVAFCLMIVAYPSAMSHWPAPGQADFATQLQAIFGGVPLADAVTGATPLDALRTGLRESGASVGQLLHGPAFGHFGGRGLEWIALGYLLGGMLLLARRIVSWHLPVAFCAGLTLTALPFWLADSGHYPSPLFHLASGGAMLAAFFIVTDPVSGATTPRGKLIFAAGAGCIAYFIRSFGAYPDGIGFAVLLMNLCVPLIDMKTQPPVFGHKERS